MSPLTSSINTFSHELSIVLEDLNLLQSLALIWLTLPILCSQSVYKRATGLGEFKDKS